MRIASQIGNLNVSAVFSNVHIKEAWVIFAKKTFYNYWKVLNQMIFNDFFGDGTSNIFVSYTMASKQVLHQCLLG